MSEQTLHSVESWIFWQQNFTEDPDTYLFLHLHAAQCAGMFLSHYTSTI